MKTLDVYVVQWLGWDWNTYRYNCGAGKDITFPTLKAARAFCREQAFTSGKKRILKRTVYERVVR